MSSPTSTALDPDDPVVKLCAAGMQAEGAGQLEVAHAYFQEAWAARQDDVDACIAAHFLARHRPAAEETLHWNSVALTHADAATANGHGALVQGFYPSLYLNLGWSNEQVGDLAAARHCYALAARAGGTLGDDPYCAVVRKGIEAGQQRIAVSQT